MNNFFIYLPSNVRNDSSHENTLAHFVTPLCSNIILEEPYEVALTEISYTYSWYSITKRQPIFVSTKYKESILDEVYIEKGHYSSLKELVDIVNSSLDALFDTRWVNRLPVLHYEETTQRVIMEEGQIHQDGGIPCIIKVGEELRGILGLLTPEEYFERMATPWIDIHYLGEETRDFAAEDIEFFKNSIKEITNAGDIKAGVNALYVYSDIVEHSFVGDSLSQILRIIPVPPDSKFGDQVVVRYEKPNYIPVQAKEIQKIELLIKDDSGENIKFNFGRVVVTLHFRKRQNE